MSYSRLPEMRNSSSRSEKSCSVLSGTTSLSLPIPCMSRSRSRSRRHQRHQHKAYPARSPRICRSELFSKRHSTINRTNSCLFCSVTWLQQANNRTKNPGHECVNVAAEPHGVLPVFPAPQINQEHCAVQRGRRRQAPARVS